MDAGDRGAQGYECYDSMQIDMKNSFSLFVTKGDWVTLTGKEGQFMVLQFARVHYRTSYEWRVYLWSDTTDRWFVFSFVFCLSQFCRAGIDFTFSLLELGREAPMKLHML